MIRLSFMLLMLLACVNVAQAKIMRPVSMESLVSDQPMILVAKVSEWLPEKPGMVLVPTTILKGKFTFERIPVLLVGDKEAADEKQVPLVLERLDRDVSIVLFASQRGKIFDVIGFTNGTWLHFNGRVEQQDGKDVTRWQFMHAETYFTRTFRGTTDEIIKAIQGGIKGEKLPAYDEKAEPGFGPPLRKKTSGLPNVNAPFGVIQLPFLGLIAALAALFPTVFGGMALMMKRWVAALSVASFITIITSIYLYFPNWLAWAKLTTFSRVWFTCAVTATLGALWAIRRYRLALVENRADEFQPRYLDRVGLSGVLVVIAGALSLAWATKWSLIESPFLELLLLSIPTVACLWAVLLAWSRTEGLQVAVSTETVGLWAGVGACVVAGMYFNIPIAGQQQVNVDNSGIKLQQEPVWVFEPTEKGEVLSSPLVVGNRVFVAVHHRQGFTQYGRIYALDRDTGNVIWEFDDDGALKPIFSSPTNGGDVLYIGEGYHTDRDSKLFCIDLATGKKRWEFATTSHTESTPATDGVHVVFGAGDDGVYCVDAKTGAKKWQYTGTNGLHVDANILLHQGRVYAGSGTSQRRKENRIFCLDVTNGQEIWGEKVEYSAWGSPNTDGTNVFFPTGNGTMSVNRDPKAGLLLCRDAKSGKPVWERALPNSIVVQPAVDRETLYVGCHDGHCYAIDRSTGDIVWKVQTGSQILATVAISQHPKTKRTEVVYVQNHVGRMLALSPWNGQLMWSLEFPVLTQQPYADTVTTPTVIREEVDGKISRRIFVGLGFGLSESASPTPRVYCLRDVNE